MQQKSYKPPNLQTSKPQQQQQQQQQQQHCIDIFRKKAEGTSSAK